MPDTSNYNPSWVSNFFDQYGLREWERLVSSPLAEISLYIHNHYLRQYVLEGVRVLEIGAGSGRFTQTLAQIRARTVVADISPVQLDLNRKHAGEYGFAAFVEDWVQADMCDLSSFADGTFEVVVAYGGPFSYVIDHRDQALQECLRVLKPGGRLLLSVMTLWGSARSALPGVLALPVETNQKITSTGDLIPAHDEDRPKGQYMHLFRSGEVRAWLKGAGLEVLALSACGCLAAGNEHALEMIRQDDVQWNELLRMELAASAEPGALDMGTHLIGVAQKP